MRFENGTIFVDGRFVCGGFSVKDGRFARVLEDPLPDEMRTDLCGALVIPGLVDIHTHGNSGADFSDGNDAGLAAMARCLAAHDKIGQRAAADRADLAFPPDLARGNERG